MLAFTPGPIDITPLTGLAQAFAGLGLTTVLLAVLKRNLERRFWRDFKRRAGDWIDRLRETENRRPLDLSNDEWMSECERMLADSKFSPLEIHQILNTSVIVAKGIAADRFLV
jgi:hypothetical protein